MFYSKQVVIPKLLDLNAFVNSSRRKITWITGENIRLGFQLSASPCLVKVDERQLELGFVNLLLNAADAMSNDGHIIVETVNCELDENSSTEEDHIVPGEYVMLSVRDCGSGMDESTKARIFEPFFTTRESRRAQGLGLSVVYGIMKENRGYVLFLTELGRGSTFKLYFPKVESDQTVTETLASPSLSSRSLTSKR